MQRYVNVKQHQNLVFDTRTNRYYVRKMRNYKRSLFSTGVKGVCEIKEVDGKLVAFPKKGYQLAIRALEEMEAEISGQRVRPTFSENSDLTLQMQKNKSPRTYVIAKDGDKNLRPFFEKYCPTLTEFVADYERYWAKYQSYQAALRPGRKLAHDRKYLVLVLNRAFKREHIRKKFYSRDFPLNEVSEPIGRALEDEEVMNILRVSSKVPGQRLHLQILLALTMGMRKKEILELQKEEIDLKKEEICLDPKRLKIRKARAVNIPISVKVMPLLKKFYMESKGKYLFPKRIKGSTYDYDQPQVDLKKSWETIRNLAGVKCRFHDLRHTAITNLVAQNIPLASISKVVGASMEMLNNVYDHLNRDSKEQFKNAFKDKFNLNDS